MRIEPPPVHPVDQPVERIASRPVLCVQATDRLADAARLMAERSVSFVPVTDPAGQPLGVVSETGLLAVLRGQFDRSAPVTSALSPLVVVAGDLPCDQAYQLCLERGVSHLGIVDGQGCLTAVVSETDFRRLLNLSALAGRHRVPVVMRPVVNLMQPGQTLREAAVAMATGTDASVVVMAEGRPTGVITSRDTTRLLASDADAGDRLLGAVMSQPVLTISVDASLNQAADMMLVHRVRHLVVVAADGQLAGMLSEHDLARSMAVGLMDASIAQERVRHRAILDAIPDLVWLKNPDGVYLACNPRFERLYGTDEARIRGKTDLDFVPPDVAASFRHHDQRAMALDVPSMNEELLTFADGHRELTHTIKAPVRDGQGRLLGVLGIGRDISALRQAEEEARYLFAHSPAPMAVYARGDQSLQAVNEAFCALYGYSQAEALQLQVADLSAPADRAQARARVAALQGLASNEWLHQRRDGRPVHVLAQSHDLQHNGRDCRMVVLTDISGIKRAQQRDSRRLALLENLAHGLPLPALLGQLAQDHEALFPASLCGVLLLSEDGQVLQQAVAPSLPGFFAGLKGGLPTLSGADGSPCGAACVSAERLIVDDIPTQPRWDEFKALAARAGLLACCSTPILGPGQRVLGSLVVLRRQAGRPDAEELLHLDFAARLAATAIDRHQAAQHLQQSERLLADTLRAVPDLIWLQAAPGQLTLGNAAFERVAGPVQTPPLPQDEGAALHAALQAANRQALAVNDAQVAANGQVSTGEQWLTLPQDGSRALFEIVTTPMHGDDGAVAGLLGVARDITLIKRGARALAEQERLVDSMFSQTTDAIVLVDPETAGFVTFNEAACQGLGYGREEFSLLHVNDIQAELDDALIVQRISEVRQGKSLSFTTRHRRKDGEVRVVALTLRSLRYAGRELVSSVWRDITESTLHEDRIRRLNRAYAVLSDVNEAIVRLPDANRLQAEVCRIAVDVGGFVLAWIGHVDDATGRVVPDQQAGASEGYVGQLQLSMTQDQGPTVQALHSGRPSVVDDIALDPSMAPWRHATTQRGFRSTASFPVLAAGRARAVLVLYADTIGHFDAEQVALYSRLVQDLAHALESIDAEQARGKEQRLREQMMESVAGLFFVLDAQRRLVMWNRRFEEVTGHAPGEILNSHAEDYVAPEARERVAEQLDRVMVMGENLAEAPMLMPDGRRVPYLLLARRVELDTGPGVVGTGIDISDRVRTERELSRHRQHLEELVALRTGELEALNQRLAQEDLRLRQMLSLSQQASALSEAELFQHGIDAVVALTGSTAGCLHSVDEDEKSLAFQGFATCTPALLRAAPGRGAPPGVWEAVLARREVVIVQEDLAAAQAVSCPPGTVQRALGVPIFDQQRIVLVLCAANKAVPYDDADVRELQLAGADLWRIVQRRRTEIALEQAKQAADSANQAKSAFLANMSHEIRTPMNAVLGFAHLMRRDALSPRQEDHLGRIFDASRHLLQLINDILDFSKIEASKVVLDPIEFMPRHSLQRVVDMVADKATTAGVDLTVDVDDTTPAQVRGDRLRLEQILLNLLSNAVKFTEQGRVDVRLAPAGAGWLRFEVADTGIGISDAQCKALFQPFMQADVSTTRRFGGTGLGLAISHRLALLMGGRIGVHSHLGQGSLFWVELPMETVVPAAPADVLPLLPVALPRPAGARPLSGHDRPGPVLQGARVLLAEDNPINQEVALELLTAQGAQVDVADDGRAALALAAQHRYDLVLMDVQMPHLDGLAATEALRRLPGWAEVPIVAMTASAFSDDRTQCMAAGMNDVLVKPVEPEALIACMRRWHRRAGDGLPTQADGPANRATAAGADAQPVDPQALRAALLRLRPLLLSHDTAATDQIDRDQLLLRQGPSALYAPLSAQVRAFAFGPALALLDEALARLDKP